MSEEKEKQKMADIMSDAMDRQANPPVVNLTEDKPSKPAKPGRIHRPGFEKPEAPDPQIARRQELEDLMSEAAEHQAQLNRRHTEATTAAHKYVSILFTPSQLAYLKARIINDKAPIAEDILVKLDSAT